jgi:hypothetical protein
MTAEIKRKPPPDRALLDRTTHAVPHRCRHAEAE